MFAAQDIKRKFDHVLDLGSGAGHFAQMLERDKVKNITMLDMSSTCCSLDQFGFVLTCPFRESTTPRF
jgi:predicted TPR repeat methyltransferase